MFETFSLVIDTRHVFLSDLTGEGNIRYPFSTHRRSFSVQYNFKKFFIFVFFTQIFKFCLVELRIILLIDYPSFICYTVEVAGQIFSGWILTVTLEILERFVNIICYSNIQLRRTLSISFTICLRLTKNPINARSKNEAPFKNHFKFSNFSNAQLVTRSFKKF